MHNSVYRAAYQPIDPMNATTRQLLPQIAFDSYASNLEEPKLKEGEFL